MSDQKKGTDSPDADHICLAKELQSVRDRIREHERQILRDWRAANPSEDPFSDVPIPEEHPILDVQNEARAIATKIIELPKPQSTAGRWALAMANSQIGVAITDYQPHVLLLKQLENQYFATLNPVCVWEAIHHCILHRLDIPDWCRRFLYGKADYLMNCILKMEFHIRESGRYHNKTAKKIAQDASKGFPELFKLSMQGKNHIGEYVKDKFKISDAGAIEFRELLQVFDEKTEFGLSRKDVAKKRGYWTDTSHKQIKTLLKEAKKPPREPFSL